MDTNAWLKEWFEKHTIISRNEIEQKSADNYLLNGWIDSLKFITLISEIEEQFGIRFANDEFQDRSFGTIDGLSKAIEDKLGK